MEVYIGYLHNWITIIPADAIEFFGHHNLSLVFTRFSSNALLKEVLRK